MHKQETKGPKPHNLVISCDTLEEYAAELRYYLSVAVLIAAKQPCAIDPLYGILDDLPEDGLFAAPARIGMRFTNDLVDVIVYTPEGTPDAVIAKLAETAAAGIEAPPQPAAFDLQPVSPEAFYDDSALLEPAIEEDAYTAAQDNFFA